MIRDEDIPPGSNELYNTLLSVGVPQKRIRQRPPRCTQHWRRVSPESQEASEIGKRRKKSEKPIWKSYDE